MTTSTLHIFSLKSHFLPLVYCPFDSSLTGI